MANEQGRYGSATREVVNDPLSPNLGAFKAPVQIQGGGVGGVASYDTSRIGAGQRAIADLLGSVSTVYETYLEKKKDQWELDGKLAYAQGKTEDEIRSSGNKYTLGGFLAMDVRTKSNEFFQNSMQQIETVDKTIDPNEYRNRLSKTYADLSERVSSSSDPFVKQLLAANAEETMPKLMEAQTKAHNSWRESQIYESFIGLGLSEAGRPDIDMETLNETLSINPGLSEERFNQARSDIVATAATLGNKKPFEALGISERDKVKMQTQGAGVPAGLVSAIMMTESRGKRYGKDGKLLTSPKGAKGEMQVMDGTNTDPGFGVRPAADNSPEERARVGRDYLGAMLKRYNQSPELAAAAYNAGPGTVDDHIAKVGDPTKGEIPILEFVKSLPFAETRKYVKDVMSRWKPDMVNEAVAASEVDADYATMISLTKQGFNPAQIKSIINSLDQYEAKRSTEFSKDRILTEQSIYESVLANGNYEAALDTIQKVKDERGYSDAWANAQANSAQSAMEKYVKSNGELRSRQSAIVNGTVRTLSPADQAKAIDENRVAIAEELIAQGIDPASSEGQAAIKAKQREFLIRNSVVDEKWKGEMSANLSGTLLTKGGQVSEGALEAYLDYMNIAKEASPGFANQFLDADAQKLVALAETYDSGMNSELALKTAIDVMEMSKSERYTAPKTAVPAEIGAIADKKIDELNPSFWAFFSKYQSADTLDISDQDISKAKSNPALKSMLTAETNRILAADTSRSMKPEAAANLAMKNIQGKVELLPGGNLAFSGRSSSIRKDMGFPEANSNNFVHSVMSEYLAHHGKAYFGQIYVGRTEDADTQAKIYKAAHKSDPDVPSEDSRWLVGRTRDAITGTPDNLYINYNPDSKSFTVDLWVDDDMGNKVLLGNSVSIPAADLGNWAKSQKVDERSYSSREQALLAKFKANRTPENQLALQREKNPWLAPLLMIGPN